MHYQNNLNAFRNKLWKQPFKKVYVMLIITGSKVKMKEEERDDLLEMAHFGDVDPSKGSVCEENERKRKVNNLTLT